MAGFKASGKEHPSTITWGHSITMWITRRGGQVVPKGHFCPHALSMKNVLVEVKQTVKDGQTYVNVVVE